MAGENFKCPNCKKKHFIPNYTTKVIKGKIVITDKQGKPLKCDCKGKPKLTYISKKKKELGFSVGKFSSMSLADKRKHLAQRSSMHSDRFTPHLDVKTMK